MTNREDNLGTTDDQDPSLPLDARDRVIHGLLTVLFEQDAHDACPPISGLWPGNDKSHDEHIRSCPRCQERRRQIEAAVHDDPERSSAPRDHDQAPGLGRLWTFLHNRRKRTYVLASSGLAMAACLALIFFISVQGVARADAMEEGLTSEISGRHKDALATANEVLHVEPSHYEARLLKARATFRLGDPIGAAVILGGILRDNPDDWAAKLHLAVVYRQSDSERADGLREQALAAAPDTTEAWYLRGLLAPTWAEAVEPYTQVIDRRPNDYRARLGRAWAYYELGRYEDMRADAGELVRLKKDWVEGWDSLGVAYDRLGRYDEAIEAHTKAIDLAPEEGSLYAHRAHVYIRAGEFDKALEDCGTAIEKDPKSVEAFWQQGRAYRYVGQLPEAIEAFETHVANKPEDPYGYLQFYIVLREAGRDEDAYAHVTAALDKVSGAPDDWPNLLLSYFAGKVTQQQLLVAAGDHNAKLCEAWYYIGERKFVQGDPNGAREAFAYCLLTRVERFIEFDLAAWRLRDLDE